MKKILLLFTLIIVTSCSDNLNCNSDEVKNQIKDIFIENTNLNSYMFSESDIDFEKLKGFYKNNVNIIQVRTSSIEKEIKKCTCEGTITFDLPQEIRAKRKISK